MSNGDEFNVILAYKQIAAGCSVRLKRISFGTSKFELTDFSKFEKENSSFADGTVLYPRTEKSWNRNEINADKCATQRCESSAFTSYSTDKDEEKNSPKKKRYNLHDYSDDLIDERQRKKAQSKSKTNLTDHKFSKKKKKIYMLKM